MEDDVRSQENPKPPNAQSAKTGHADPAAEQKTEQQITPVAP